MTYINNYDKIERYLSNEMEEGELILFEQELLEDLGLASELQFHLYVDCNIARSIYPSFFSVDEPASNVVASEGKAEHCDTISNDASVEKKEIEVISSHGKQKKAFQGQSKFIFVISQFVALMTGIFFAVPKQSLLSKATSANVMIQSN